MIFKYSKRFRFAPSFNKHIKFDASFDIRCQLEHFEYDMNRTEVASWLGLRSFHQRPRRQHELRRWHWIWASATGVWRPLRHQAAGGCLCCRRWSCTATCWWDRRPWPEHSRWVGKSIRRCADWRWFQNRQWWDSCHWHLFGKKEGIRNNSHYTLDLVSCWCR